MILRYWPMASSDHDRR